jgi:hypothetical protein
MPSGKIDWSKPLGQRRPKVMERMPDPPPPAKGSAFDVDTDKLRNALPPPVSSAEDDLKVLGMVFGTAFLVLGWAAFTIWALLTAPPLGGLSTTVLLLALVWWLAVRR